MSAIVRRALPWTPLGLATALGGFGLWLEAVDPRASGRQ
jgi:hypothetical protein